MSIISIIIVLVILGVLLWFVETYIPMSPPFKTAIRIVVVVGLLLWLLQVFGVYTLPLRLR